MARYIDAEALTDRMLERYDDLCEKHGDYDHYTTGYGDAIDAIENAPAADVVPKRKYDLAVAEREANVKGFTEELAKAKTEVAREIFEEIEEGIKAAFAALQFERNPVHRKVKNETYSSLMRFVMTVEKKYTEGVGQ